MTLQYSTTCAHLFLGMGIRTGLGGTNAITIYAGSKPTAAAIAAGFAAYNSANAIFLAHYVGATWSQSGILVSLIAPAAVNASNSGTGVWAIIWGANTPLASMGAALPTTSFMVVDVTDTSGNGIIRFADPAFTAGVSKGITDGAFGAVMS
jgi:hypothetical protein